MGLTFKIDTSATSGKPISVVWASIPHKTVTAAGPYGYPDKNYFATVNRQLDRLGIPTYISNDEGRIGVYIEFTMNLRFL